MRTGFTLTGQTDTITRINTGRHLDRKGLVLFDTTFAVAGTARISNDLALAMATRAGLLNREEALLHAHLTNTTTGRAGRRRRALLGPGAVTRLAVDQCRHTDIDRGTTHRFFQVQLQGVAQVAATLGTTARATAAAAEEVAEHVTENIGEVRATKAGTAATHARIDTGMTVLIIGGALAGIGEHFVSLVGFLEFLFRLFVIRVTVRVMLHRQAAIGLLQVRFTGAALNSQNFVIVTLCHKSLHS
ncbi:hypothetical protein D9M71_398650 [compost metagenome]